MNVVYQGQGTLLHSLSPKAREAFIGSCRKICLTAKSDLFVRGEPCSHIYLICSGLVRIYYESYEGKEMSLAYFGPGTLIGDPGFLSHAPYAWSAQTERESILLTISAKDLRELIHRDVELTDFILKTLSFKVHWLSSLFQIMGTESVDKRLLHLLLKLSELDGYEENGIVVVSMNLTHKQLATMVGASRPWVSAALTRLQREGLISVRKDSISLLDPNALRESYL